jgi:hypothetical protein
MRHLPFAKDLPVASLLQQNSSSDGSRTPWQLLPLQSHQLVITSVSFQCPSHLTSFVTIFWSSPVQSLWQPTVFSSSVAQNSATVTPWAHARHEAVIAKQQNCGFGWHVGQHSPSGVTMIWSALHSGRKHDAALQSTGGFGGGKALQVGQHSPLTAYKNWLISHSTAAQKTSAHFETHTPSRTISFSSHSRLHPGVLFSSVAQNSATVTPRLQAEHSAVNALQHPGRGRQVGQHSPSRVTVASSSLHMTAAHKTTLQSTGGFGGKALQVEQHSPSSV